MLGRAPLTRRVSPATSPHMGQTSDRPPFATPTLARLYLAQGHVDAARAMLSELKARGEPGLEALEAAIAAAPDPVEALLQGLLVQIRERRRPAGPSPAG